VGKNGGVDVALESLESFKSNPKIVLSGLKLLRALAVSKDNTSKMQNGNAISICVEAMYANGDNVEIQKIGTQLLKSILDEKSVLDAIKRLKKYIVPMTKKGDEKAGNEVRKAVTQLAILANAEAKLIHKNGGVPAVLDALKSVLDSTSNPSQRAAVIDGCFRMLDAMVKNCDGIKGAVFDQILPKVDIVIDFVRYLLTYSIHLLTH